VLNPRAPKIRYLNASHTLLMEMEKHVKKVQELEEKVFELEMQLQLKEVAKNQDELTKMPANKTTEEAAKDAEMAFNKRLAEARKKCELLTAKRMEEEEAVTRMYHKKRLKNVIDEMTIIPETETKVMFLPTIQSKEVQEPDSAENKSIREAEDLLASAEAEMNLKSEIDKIKEMFEERNSLKAILEDAKAQKAIAETTYDECLLAVSNLSAAWSKFRASLKMADQLTSIMKKSNTRNNSHKLFVFGPNSIFSSVKEQEISYAISNHFAIETLKELDMSSIIVEQNLKSAKKCLRKAVENCSQAESALLFSTEMLDQHTARVKELRMKQRQKTVDGGEDADKNVIIH